MGISLLNTFLKQAMTIMGKELFGCEKSLLSSFDYFPLSDCLPHAHFISVFCAYRECDIPTLSI